MLFFIAETSVTQRLIFIDCFSTKNGVHLCCSLPPTPDPITLGDDIIANSSTHHTRGGGMYVLWHHQAWAKDGLRTMAALPGRVNGGMGGLGLLSHPFSGRRSFAFPAPAWLLQHCLLMGWEILQSLWVRATLSAGCFLIGSAEKQHIHTLTFRAFSRGFYPKRLIISTFVRRRWNSISLSVQ